MPKQSNVRWMPIGHKTPYTLLVIYKLNAIWAGMAFAYMGYKLFMAGVFEHAGQLEQSFGREHLLLKEAAPGTFFAVLGCVIIVVALWKGISIREDADGSGAILFRGVVARAEPDPSLPSGPVHQ